jgi:DNA-binding transcriptional MerR regulator
MAGAHRPVYVISIAAGLAGCHPRTLRIYEEEGLLEPVRTETNIRLYSDDDLQRVRVIRYLTQVRGVNLAGVKLLLHMRDATDLMEDLMRELGELAADDDDDASAEEDTAEVRIKRGRNEGTRF